MLKDITLGQYFPGDTVIHRLDPRTKMIFILAYMIALFTVKSWVGYSVMFLILAVATAVSRIPPMSMLRGLKPLALIIVFTAILNMLYTHEGSVLVSFWVIKITDSGLLKAVYMVVRIMLLVTGTFLLTYTTTPMSLTDGLEKLLAPLGKIKVPVHELAMMMSIALRFIPTLIEETDKIMSAQKARGADFETGRLIDRAKALLPLLVPLFVNAFRRADELATAMEARCYSAGGVRTRMNPLKMQVEDYAFLAFSVVMLAAMIVLGRFGF